MGVFGFVAVLVRTIAIALMHLEEFKFANLPWLALGFVVIAGLLGSYFVQNAYSKGPPDLVIAGLTVIDPIIGIAIGISILNELRPDVPGVIGVVMGIAGLLAIVRVVLLPVIRYSVVWWNSLHQGQTISLLGESKMDPSMLPALWAMVVGTHLWFVGSLLARARADNLWRESGKDWVRRLGQAPQ